MIDEGRSGNEPIAEGAPVEEHARVEVTLEQGERNEFGELDGEKMSGVPAEVFVNGGKTGTATVHWAGGGGGLATQGVGDVTLVAPTYDGADPAAAGGQASAWVNTGTGTATVTRSYTGVLVGANGTYYITASAAARIDRHEETHISSTSSIHNTHIVPLEQRIAQHLGSGKPRASGTTRAQAIAALQTFIDWNTSVTAFRNADSTANRPGGTTDTTDSGTADFYRDYGARTVGGTNYAHYIDTPPGPAPAAPPSP